MEKDSPAFPECLPLYERPDQYGEVKITGFATSGGLTAQAYAAIHLRVPESGIEWLDRMIERSRWEDDARVILGGLFASPLDRGGESTDNYGQIAKSAANMLRAALSPAAQPADITEDFTIVGGERG